MAQSLNTNDEVVAYFRSNFGHVPAPYTDDPPPMILLHTTGRRTGRDHITPMRAMVVGADLYVFGTAHGSQKDPDWVRNIRANARVSVEIGRETRAMRGHVVPEPDRTRIWTHWADAIPALHDIATKANRPVPVVKLEPAP